MLVAVGVALCALDDILIDIAWGVRWIWRRLTVYRWHPRASAARLPAKPPAPMAIFVPAWHESAVIGDMLRALLERLDYPDYRVFVGVYPNDAGTRATVEGVGDPRVVLAIADRDGPTTKADNLNSIWRAMLAHEDAAIR